MVTEAILWLFTKIAKALLYLLPDWSPFDVSGLASAVAPLLAPGLAFVAWLDHYFPAKQLIGLMAVVVTMYVAAHVYRAAVWLASKARLLGAS